MILLNGRKVQATRVVMNLKINPQFFLVFENVYILESQILSFRAIPDNNIPISRHTAFFTISKTSCALGPGEA